MNLGEINLDASDLANILGEKASELRNRYDHRFTYRETKNNREKAKKMQEGYDIVASRLEAIVSDLRA